jgi:protein phosphatase
VIEIAQNKKSPLSQCLGIPEDDFIIEPYITKFAYENNEKYLICSDGLTDMVEFSEISNILSSQESALRCGQMLMDNVMINGGKDNVTVIVCEIKKGAQKQ